MGRRAARRQSAGAFLVITPERRNLLPETKSLYTGVLPGEQAASKTARQGSTPCAGAC